MSSTAGAINIFANLHYEKLTSGLADIQGKLGRFGKRVDGVGKTFSKLKSRIGIVAGAAGLIAFGKAGVEATDKVAKGAKRVGMSASNFQSLSHAMERSGGTAQSFEQATTSMSKSILTATLTPTSKAGLAFQALGLDLEKINKMNQGDKFRTIAKSLENIQDPAKRAAVAAQLFGRSGKDVLALSNDLEVLEDQFKKSGKEMSAGELSDAGFLKDTFDDIGSSIMRIGANLARSLMPVIKLVGNALVWAADKFAKFVDFGRRIQKGIGLDWLLGIKDLPSASGIKGATTAMSIDRSASKSATAAIAKQDQVVATLKGDELKIEKSIKIQESQLENLKATKTALAPLAPAMEKGTKETASFIRNLGRQKEQAEINQRHKNAVEFAKQSLDRQKEELKEAKKQTKEAEKQTKILEKQLKEAQRAEDAQAELGAKVTSIMN